MENEKILAWTADIRRSTMASPECLPDTIDQLCKVKDSYVDAELKWFQTHQLWPRLLFRLAGMTVIILSLAIPFLAAPVDYVPKWGVPLASFLIAVTTGLNSFFHWQATWQKRINIETALKGWIALWETKILAARKEDSLKGYQMALEATQDLIEKTQSIQVTETALLFAMTKFPKMEPGTKPSLGNTEVKNTSGEISGNK
jgi:hypothetical protein